MEKSGAGVRRGAWTKEEDILLSKCIEKYGEGKWHQVPPRAGLNRCRKSCRLRWLNYLRPNIKRGYFSKDEVDLIVRLHKLLGNRWSLIAGRLPGRTANDVKNFWNTHIQKKLSTKESNNENENVQKTITKSNIVRPQPRTFSKSHVIKPNQTNGHESKQLSLSASSSQDDLDECVKWWSNLLEATELGEEINTLPFSNEDQQIEHSLIELDDLIEHDGFSNLDFDMEFDRFHHNSFNPFD